MARDKAEIIKWARNQAQELTKEMKQSNGSTSTWWVAQPTEARERIHGRAIAALECLRLHAGDASQWFVNALAAFNSGKVTTGDVTGSRLVGSILDEWASHVENDSFVLILNDESSARSVVATDLMDQVRILNADSNVHEAAPMTLAGAAAEIALRDLMNQYAVTASKPGMTAMAEALKKSGQLTTQDVKDLNQIAGLRNLAAHGDFDELSRERAGLMEQQVNLFLSRLQAIAQT